MFTFVVTYTDGSSLARCGRIETAHGTVQTPCFMPVATQGAVKAVDGDEVLEAGFRMVIVNSYHMMLRPGVEVVERMGGLHAFMSWPHAIATDSGGFQALSLSRKRTITERGIRFQSHIDGKEYMLTPALSVAVQASLASDVMMCLDECPPYPADRSYIERSVRLTECWAEECLEHAGSRRGGLFAILQGGVYTDLRASTARRMASMEFDGFAIGGLGVGESVSERVRAVDACVEFLPDSKPRYLMGVGTPADIVRAVMQGVDMFDCVLPTRNARRGTLFTNGGKLVIKNARYAGDPRPIDERCSCRVCRTYSRAYLRHLFMAGEVGVLRLLTLHNLHYYSTLMARVREAIERGEFASWAGAVLESETEENV